MDVAARDLLREGEERAFRDMLQIQDELFGSFEQLLSLADAKGATYDR